CFVLLLIRPPQNSPAFPYTTLFRSRLTLQTIPQTFEISKEGYEPKSISVTPQNGAPKRIDVALKSAAAALKQRAAQGVRTAGGQDRKSTRLNSSHVKTSYAVFCLNK